MFDSITLPPFGNESVFLAKYDPSGAILWVHRYAPGLGGAVHVLGADCLYFTGAASGIVGQPAFDAIPWQYVDRAIFTARYCDLTTGIGTAHTAEGATLWPNPANVQLNISVAACTTAWIIDATGRVLREVDLRSGTASIPLTDLHPGSYALRLGTGEVLRFVNE